MEQGRQVVLFIYFILFILFITSYFQFLSSFNMYYFLPFKRLKLIDCQSVNSPG